MNVITICITVSLLYFSALVHAEPSCNITDYGIVEPGKLALTVDEANAATGKAHYYTAGAIRERTDRIPARLGLRFGVKHVFREIPLDGGLQVVVNHPPMKNSAGVMQSSSRGSKDPTDVGFNYGFDRPTELLPGSWIFQFHYKGRVLCEKSFTVFME